MFCRWEYTLECPSGDKAGMHPAVRFLDFDLVGSNDEVDLREGSAYADCNECGARIGYWNKNSATGLGGWPAMNTYIECTDETTDACTIAMETSTMFVDIQANSAATKIRFEWTCTNICQCPNGVAVSPFDCATDEAVVCRTCDKVGVKTGLICFF